MTSSAILPTTTSREKPYIISSTSIAATTTSPTASWRVLMLLPLVISSLATPVSVADTASDTTAAVAANAADIAVLHEVHQPTSPRLVRSPFSPPTVTSLQPHRKGVPSRMHDQTLLVGRQSEGPSHPLLMRRAPPRKSSSEMLPEAENISRPHTMYFLPDAEVEAVVQLETDFTNGRSYPQDGSTSSGIPFNGIVAASYRQESPHSNQHYYDQYIDELSSSPPEYHHRSPLPSRAQVLEDTDHIDERSSRQRRVESSSHVESDIVGRHGRFGSILGDRNTQNNVERFDTFGHQISEQTWVGPKRSTGPIHPAARGKPIRNRQPGSEDNSIWSRKNGQRYSRPVFYHPFITEGQGPNSANTRVESQNDLYSNRAKTNRFVHPGARMPSQGFSGEDGRHVDRIIIEVTGEEGVGHPRMLRPTTHDSRAKQVVNNNIVSLDDIMRETNQTYEQLTKNLEMKGLTLSYLYRLTSSGASLEDILNLLSLPELENTTIYTSGMQTIDPHIWMIEEFERKKEALSDILQLHKHTYKNGTEWDRELTEFSDPIYAMGVHPINEDSSNREFIFPSSFDGMDSSYDQYSNESYGYYSDELVFDEPRRTSGQARIHSLSVHEIPPEQEKSSYTREADTTNYVPQNVHPHYNPQDQLFIDHSSSSRNSHSTNKLTPMSSSNIRVVDMQENGSSGWSSAARDQSEETIESRPFTYTIIAASAVMASLAVFTLFVLVAYSIVKCTKKPTLNNYQVSAKKPVEVAA